MNLDHYEVNKEGFILSRKTGKPLAVHVDKKGYERVRLKSGGQGKTCLVHRLIATKFIPNPLGLPQVNHIDGNKSNNHYTNLEWCTCQQNNDHAVATGLVKRGDKRPNGKLSDEQVLRIRSLRTQGATYYQLSQLFGISYQGIHKVCARLTYTHV